MEPSVPGSLDATRTAASVTPPSLAFGAYRLLQKLGEGGMGEVWLAEQTRPVRRQVALKIIKAGMDTAQVVARFEAERQALALMDHPAIATVFDGGSTPEGRPYFAMEYVKGEPITTYCDRHRLSTRERLELFVLVCGGVQHAHQKGIIHRDLKPSNVLVTLQDDRPVPKIIDFGVAKATTQHLTERSLFTELGVLIGTPEYMSPEQADLTSLDVDTRTDIYSLGVLLYELLTGALPFDRKTLREKALEEIRRVIREVDPPRPSTRVTHLGPASTEAARSRRTEPARLASELRGDLDWITMKALDKDRTRRYGSASEFAADVDRHLANHPVVAGPPSATYRTRKFVRRHRFGVAAASAAIVVLVAFAVAMAVQAQRIARERDRAVAAEKTATQVSSFLVDLFRSSDPTGVRGNTVTVREILDRGAAQVDRDLASQPLVQVNLQDTLGRVYDNLGLFDQAQPLLENALAARRRLVGEDHVDVATSLVSNATFWFHKGEFKKAKPMLERALAIRQQALGPEDPAVATCLHNLGNMNLVMADYDEAERLLLQSLAIREKKLPPDAPDTATTVNSLGAVAYRKSDMAKARELWERTLAMRERVLGLEHPDVAQTLNNLALVHTMTGDAGGATPLLERVIRIQEKNLGPKHPDLAFALGNLGDAQLRLENNVAARESYDRAVRILEATNPSHPEVGRFLVGLSMANLQQGDTAAARESCERSLAIREKAFGKGHQETAMSLFCLANCDRQDRLYDAAEELYNRALAMVRRPDGQYENWAADFLVDYAAFLEQTGRAEKAAEIAQAARTLQGSR